MRSSTVGPAFRLEMTSVVGRAYLNLRLLPLVDVGLFDLEVHAFDSTGTAHDLDASEVRLEVIQHALGLVQELVQPTRSARQTRKCIGRYSQQRTK